MAYDTSEQQKIVEHLKAKKPFDRLFIFDLETTGLSRHDRITEVAISSFCGETAKSWLCNPGKIQCHMGCNSGNGNRAEQLTGISRQSLRNMPLFPAVWAELLQFVEFSAPATKSEQVVLISHNLSFDIRMILQELQRWPSSHRIPGNWRFSCSVSLSKAVWYKPQLRSYSLGALCKHVGVTNDEAHRALSDVHALRLVIIAALCSQPRLKLLSEPAGMFKLASPADASAAGRRHPEVRDEKLEAGSSQRREADEPPVTVPAPHNCDPLVYRKHSGRGHLAENNGRSSGVCPSDWGRRLVVSVVVKVLGPLCRSLFLLIIAAMSYVSQGGINASKTTALWAWSLGLQMWMELVEENRAEESASKNSNLTTEPTSAAVFVTRTGVCYHQDRHCRHLKRSKFVTCVVHSKLATEQLRPCTSCCLRARELL